MFTISNDEYSEYRRTLRSCKIKNYFLGFFISISVALIISVILMGINIQDIKKENQDYEKLSLDYGLLEQKYEKLVNQPVETETIKPDSIEVPTDIVVKDTELMEFVIDYLKAQTSYIDQLTYILDQNQLSYPVFYYKQLEDIIEENEVKSEVVE